MRNQLQPSKETELEIFENVAKRGFDRIHERFDVIDGRLDGIDKKFDAADRRFDRLETKLDNNHKEVITQLGEIKNNLELL